MCLSKKEVFRELLVQMTCWKVPAINSRLIYQWYMDVAKCSFITIAQVKDLPAADLWPSMAR